MTLRLQNIDIPVADYIQNPDLRGFISELLGIRQDNILRIDIQKKSLDARKKQNIVYCLQLHIDLVDEQQILAQHSTLLTAVESKSGSNPFEGFDSSRLRSSRLKPVIIGSGPAGIFTALTLAKQGIASTIVERGQPVEQRMRDVNALRRGVKFTPESNYCFGEGGAGTFSDGKLSCGKNHPLIRFVFEELVRFGAPADILFEAKPHIGTDFLMRIAKNMRVYLESIGCEFKFNRKWTDFKYNAEHGIYDIILDDRESIETEHMIVAIGHSARDTYKMLLKNQVNFVPKPFAMGARFEHPQDKINSIQFGACPFLPAAEYKLVTHVSEGNAERGIWTFCMCPGGYLLPTSAQDGHLAINGMSYHGRRSGYANAAVVVNVLREDFYKDHPLDGMYFQEKYEKMAFVAGGSNYHSPAQRMGDFLAGRPSRGELSSTYKPGVTAARMDQLLPGFIRDALKKAIGEYDKKMRGYICDEAMVIGLESKTSSPISIMRDQNLQSISHPKFFPTGEGAGFAGGIVSAALDGVRVGKSVVESMSIQA